MSKRKRQHSSHSRRLEPASAGSPRQAHSPAAAATVASTTLPIAAARVCLVIAAGVALYLLWVSLRGGSVAGCGPGSDCDKVLQSRWSKWFGLPVSGFSLLVYAGLFASSFGLGGAANSRQRQRADALLLPVAILVLGAALWFVVVQFAMIKAFCPYCMTAHALGSLAAILLLVAQQKNRPTTSTKVPSFRFVGAAAGLLVVFIGGQILHEPAGHLEQSVNSLMPNAPALGSNRTSPLLSLAATQAVTRTTQDVAAVQPPPTPAVTNPPTPPVASSGTNRSFAIYNGQFQFNLDEVPLIGPPTAPRIMVSLFDYTCHHCRTMHERLLEAHRAWPTNLAIIALPMPLDPQCNPTMTRPHPDHVNACFFGRLGLAVVRADRAKAALFDEFIFKPERPPATNEAMTFAEQLVGSAALKRALADPWVEHQLKQSVSIYEISYRAGQGSMPQSIIGNRIAVGLMRLEDLVRILGEELGLKPPAP